MRLSKTAGWRTMADVAGVVAAGRWIGSGWFVLDPIGSWGGGTILLLPPVFLLFR